MLLPTTVRAASTANVAVASSRLSRIVLMVRGSQGLASATEFYHQAIGLPVLRVTDDWAELAASSHVTLHLLATNAAASHGGAQGGGEALLSTGYSPMLTFEVTNMDGRIAACAQAGGHLDGPVQYPAHGKVAVLRTPHGHMVGLYEPAVAAASAFNDYRGPSLS
jgi:catechol 2,3-dioxygenase-like lactoylglutathione lyase family enzyme